MLHQEPFSNQNSIYEYTERNISFTKLLDLILISTFFGRVEVIMQGRREVSTNN